ncbi:MAG: insulinase family protein, partial [Bacilli bacterium]|nr:insulinase family protein [Bacilli bacterium]
MHKHVHQPMNETVYRHTLNSGMRVEILAKPGFARKAATLLIPFGSIDELVDLGFATDIKNFPQGTAHFLEHMLFENQAKNVTREFALLGASVNAYTTFNRTGVYFSTTNGLEKPLELLFEMLAEVNFDIASVDKERAIIEKEIDMYQDDIEQQLYYDLMRSLYFEHEIANDIAGTRESLALIDSKSLESAFKTFYRPEMMVLTLTGDIDPQAIVDLLEKQRFLKRKNNIDLPLILHKEEPECVKSDSVTKFVDVANDLVMVGVKLQPRSDLTPWEQQLLELKWFLLLDNLFGKQSANFEQMQKRKLINNTFEVSQTIESSFAHLIFFAETNRPQALSDYLLRSLQDLSGATLDLQDFYRQRKKMIGDFIEIFDSIT